MRELNRQALDFVSGGELALTTQGAIIGGIFGAISTICLCDCNIKPVVMMIGAIIGAKIGYSAFDPDLEFQKTPKFNFEYNPYKNL
jgi:hypothetical protein